MGGGSVDTHTQDWRSENYYMGLKEFQESLLFLQQPWHMLILC